MIKNTPAPPRPPRPISRIIAMKDVSQGQGVTKRCRLSWLTVTNGGLVYEPKCGGEGGIADLSQ
jgi:hypothetical protein